MDSKHTPGPWYWSDNVPDFPKNHCIIVDADGFTIAEPSLMGEANARLIAAAPDMFDLLYTVLPYIEDLELDQMYKPGVVAALTRRIRDTLDKAEGVQP